jgi:hypothetical protein
MSALPIRQWLISSIARIERDPEPSDRRDRALASLRSQLDHHNDKLAPLERLLSPNSMGDWLDRRAGLEVGAKRDETEQMVQNWLAQHHPRFGGKAS